MCVYVEWRVEHCDICGESDQYRYSMKRATWSGLFLCVLVSVWLFSGQLLKDFIYDLRLD